MGIIYIDIRADKLINHNNFQINSCIFRWFKFNDTIIKIIFEVIRFVIMNTKK